MTTDARQTGTLEAIVRTAPDAIVTADADGMIVTWNPAGSHEIPSSSRSFAGSYPLHPVGSAG